MTYPSSSDGRLRVLASSDGPDAVPTRFVDRSLIMDYYRDYLDSRKSGFDVMDNVFHFITKDGELHSVDGYSDIPSFRKSDVIYAEWWNAEETVAWYNPKASGYQEKIKRVTGLTVK